MATYEMTNEGIFRLIPGKKASDEPVPQQLTNFLAKIVKDSVMIDGDQQEHRFLIEVQLGDKRSTVEASAKEFAEMNWPLEKLGAEAIIYAGYNFKEYARHAIQEFSKEIKVESSYVHLGWIEQDGRLGFVHGGDIVWATQAEAGANGTLEEGDCPPPNPLEAKGLEPAGTKGTQIQRRDQSPKANVAIPESLVNFRLSYVPDKEKLIKYAKCSLLYLDLQPKEVVYPLLAATFRAPLGNVHYGIHIDGETGNGKSTLAAIPQQHFGAAMDAEHLPGSWSSTANSLEATTHLAKDVLFTVDDLVPMGGLGEMQRQFRDMDRLLRGLANGSGRARCRSNGKPIQGRHPRALIVSTGEAPPPGHSLNARILKLELKESIFTEENLPKLRYLQQAAQQGVFSSLMAAYIKWLADHYKQQQAEFEAQREVFRHNSLCLSDHPRHAAMMADLLAGFEPYLEFLEEIGAISQEKSDQLFYKLQHILIELMERQNVDMGSVCPAEQFIELVGSLLSSGRAHLANVSGGPPENDPEVFGWDVREWYERSKTSDGSQDDDDSEDEETDGGVNWVKRSRITSRGQKIGWVHEDNVYLQPDSALAEVLRLARDSGVALPLTRKTLGRALHSAGKLFSADRSRGRYTFRKRIHGERVDCYLISKQAIYPKPEPAGPHESYSGSLLDLLEEDNY